MSKIIKLQTENVKRLHAVEITPDGNMVIIGGNNAQGKSSVLDSILYALAGAGAIPGKPVREGEEQADIVVDIDSDPPLKIHRKIAANGRTTLKITRIIDDEEYVVNGPQGLLNEMTGGDLIFDPLEFERMRPQDQVDALKKAVGVSTKDLDEKEDQLFHDRADKNRQLKQLQAELKTKSAHDVGPEEKHSSHVLDKINKWHELKDAATASRNRLTKMEESRDDIYEELNDAKANVARLEKELAAAKKLAKSTTAKANVADKEIEEFELEHPPSLKEHESLKAELEGIEEYNRRVRENASYLEVRARVNQFKKEIETLEADLTRTRSERIKRMKEAKWPVEGLGFSRDGVTFNDLPFEQCSSAERMKISVGIGVANKPELKILFIRDGSLLDKNSLKEIGRMADEKGFQVWIERVGMDDECAIIIEDGTIL